MINLNLQNREELLKKFESWVEIPMLILVSIMIVTLIAPLVVTLSEQTRLTLELIDGAIWAVFAMELGIRTYLAPKKLAYLRTNWIDVVVVVLPVLRIFRTFEAARLLQTLRFTRVVALFGKFTQEIRTVLARHYFHYLFVVLIGLTAIGTILIYHFDIGNNIQNGVRSLPDALWLVIVTVFSGGYENIFPATPESRGVSILLILFGTVVVSYFTASLASYFTEKDQDKEQARIEKKLDTLIEEIRKLENKIMKK